MPEFSKLSIRRRDTCQPLLIAIVNDAIKITNFSILRGHRNEVHQNDAYESGDSKLPWPQSKHNITPSQAIDIAPYPINWDETLPNLARYYFLAGIIKRIAAERNIPIRWGGDWDGDGDFSDQTFNDLVHYELI